VSFFSPYPWENCQGFILFFLVVVVLLCMVSSFTISEALKLEEMALDVMSQMFRVQQECLLFLAKCSSFSWKSIALGTIRIRGPTNHTSPNICRAGMMLIYSEGWERKKETGVGKRRLNSFDNFRSGWEKKNQLIQFKMSFKQRLS